MHLTQPRNTFDNVNGAYPLLYKEKVEAVCVSITASGEVKRVL
jgi:hypothetical protein